MREGGRDGERGGDLPLTLATARFGPVVCRDYAVARLHLCVHTRPSSTRFFIAPRYSTAPPHCASLSRFFSTHLYRAFMWCLSCHLIAPPCRASRSRFVATFPRHLIAPPYRASFSRLLVAPPDRTAFSRHLVTPPCRATFSRQLIALPYRASLSRLLVRQSGAEAITEAANRVQRPVSERRHKPASVRLSRRRDSPWRASALSSVENPPVIIRVNSNNSTLPGGHRPRHASPSPGHLPPAY